MAPNSSHIVDIIRHHRLMWQVGHYLQDWINGIAVLTAAKQLHDPELEPRAEHRQLNCMLVMPVR